LVKNRNNHISQDRQIKYVARLVQFQLISLKVSGNEGILNHLLLSWLMQKAKQPALC